MKPYIDHVNSDYINQTLEITELKNGSLYMNQALNLIYEVYNYVIVKWSNRYFSK
jgi:hypothetical protein